jgi:hypothetical protein
MFEPVALLVHGQDVSMVGQAINFARRGYASKE